MGHSPGHSQHLCLSSAPSPPGRFRMTGYWDTSLQLPLGLEACPDAGVHCGTLLRAPPPATSSSALPSCGTGVLTYA